MDLVSGSIRPNCAGSPKRNNVAFVICSSRKLGNFTKQSYPKKTWVLALPGKRCLCRKVFTALISSRWVSVIFFLVKKKSQKQLRPMWNQECELLQFWVLIACHFRSQPQGCRLVSYCLPEGTPLELLVFIYLPRIQPKSPHHSGSEWRASALEVLKMQMCKNSWPTSPSPRKVLKYSGAWRRMLKRGAELPSSFPPGPSLTLWDSARMTEQVSEQARTALF